MSNNLIKKITWYIAGFVVGGSAIAALTVFAAWSDPSQPPTGGNPDAPLNVGGSTQVKEGSLDVNSNLTTRGYLTVSRTGTGAFAFTQLNAKGPSGGCTGCTSGLGYTWRMFTSANDATGTGINPNAFEIWEYPDIGGSHARLQIEEKAVGVNPGVVLINKNGTLQVNKDGAAQYTDLQEPTLSLAERTDVTGKQAWIQLHNAGNNEAFMRLGKGSGIRRFEFGDNQGLGVALLAAAPNEGDATAINKHFAQFRHTGATGGNVHIDALRANAAGNLVGSNRGTYVNWFGGTGGVWVGNGASARGNLYTSNVFYNGALTNDSSLRFKKDIADTSVGLDEILDLRPVTYQYIDQNTDKTQIGLIAEEVAPVLDVVVAYDEEGRPSGIDYTKLTIPLINAVQTLNDRIEALEEKTILKSPNGSCFEVRVGDDGVLSTEKIDCRAE